MIIFVDASCSGNPGFFEYRGIDKDSNNEIFSFSYPYGTNNIGEFLAIVHAMGYMKQNNIVKGTIYTDSKTAMAWIRNKKCNTKLNFENNNKETDTLKNIIKRAENFLTQKNDYQVIKWNTKKLGDIPADYGRK